MRLGLDKGLQFYRDFVGFTVLFERPENRLVYMAFYGSEISLARDYRFTAYLLVESGSSFRDKK
jgi:hypothetical protein